MTPKRDERGQVTVLIIGFAAILLVAIAVVVDASAAFLQRQGLATYAEGAALQGADLGSVGIFTEGVPDERLDQHRAAAAAAVGDYLRRTGAYQAYPGLSYRITLDSAEDRITVHLAAPLDLPLTVPGSPARPTIGARGTAAVAVDR